MYLYIIYSMYNVYVCIYMYVTVTIFSLMGVVMISHVGLIAGCDLVIPYSWKHSRVQIGKNLAFC